MRVLKELVSIVNKNKVRQIEVIGNACESYSKVHEFYHKLLEEELKTDEEAARFFYNKPSTSSSYRNLKNTLINRLINTAFFIDVRQNKYNEYQRAYYNCWKDWASANVLMGKGARQAPFEIAKRVLQQAKRYDFSDLTVATLRLLRKHASVFDGNLRDFEKYNAAFQKYERQLQAEDKANAYYLQMVVKYIRNKAPRQEMHQFAKEAYDSIKDQMEEFDSHKLHLFGNMLHIAVYMSINDYRSTVTVCKKAARFFRKKKFKIRTSLLIILHQQLVCHTQLKEYKKGKKVAMECTDLLTKEDTYNLIKNQELLFILAMHTKNYQEAYEHFKKAAEHRAFKNQPSRMRESWVIYEAYLHYLVVLGKIKPDADDNRFNNFRLGKFLNEVPSFSKDKRRYNIPVLIIQTLFLIVQKRYMEAIDRIEAVDKYCYRYLRKDDTFRSNCFIKSLLLIPICSFHKAAVTRKAQKYLKQLEQVPLEIANQPHEVEILPYEDLWELALLSLENKFYKEPRQKRRSRR
jgi:hypothetical protein